MEPRPRPSSTDLSSRILSIISLVIAIGAIGYIYTQDRIAGSREQLVSSFDKQLGEQAAEYQTARENMDERYLSALERQDARMEAWNTQLNSAIASFTQDADALLARMDTSGQTASEDRELAFRKKLNIYSALASRNPAVEPSALSGPNNLDDPADVAPEIPADDQADETTSVDLASLRVTNTVLRPGTGNTTLIEIKNDGIEDALIERIRFRPEAEFETTGELELSGDALSSTVTTIEYDDSDNTSTRSGYHGIYDRQLTEKIRVPAGETVTLRVIISGAQYEGWGFTGKLVLDYNSEESLSVESARVAFRGNG